MQQAFAFSLLKSVMNIKFKAPKNTSYENFHIESKRMKMKDMISNMHDVKIHLLCFYFIN